MGIPLTDLTLPKMVIFMKVVVSTEITYYTIVGLIKTSILLVYLRFGMFIFHRTATSVDQW